MGKIRRINYLILGTTLAGAFLVFTIKEKIFPAIAFLSGGFLFFILFVHLQTIVKKLMSGKKSVLLFTYFGRLFLITLFFYGSINISKEFFLFAMFGLICSSLSLILEGFISIFERGEENG